MTAYPVSLRRIVASLVLGVIGAGVFAGLPQAHAASALNHGYQLPTPTLGTTRIVPNPRGPSWGCATTGCASLVGVPRRITPMHPPGPCAQAPMIVALSGRCSVTAPILDVARG